MDLVLVDLLQEAVVLVELVVKIPVVLVAMVVLMVVVAAASEEVAAVVLVVMVEMVLLDLFGVVIRIHQMQQMEYQINKHLLLVEHSQFLLA